MSPKRSDLVLSTDVPHVELRVLVGHGLDVEADCGNGGNVALEFELVQDGWHTRSVLFAKVCLGLILVLPAASSPSINSRISFDPKILFIIFEIEPPIAPVACGAPAETIGSPLLYMNLVATSSLMDRTRDLLCSGRFRLYAACSSVFLASVLSLLVASLQPQDRIALCEIQERRR